MINLTYILKLERPLAIVDVETTGLNSEQERIVQIAVTVHYPDKESKSWGTLVNPERPIPHGSTNVHRITDDKVAAAPKFKQFAKRLAETLLIADIGGQNAGFDIRFIRAEMKRAGVSFEWDNHIIDTLAIEMLMNPHTLENIYRRHVNSAGFPKLESGETSGHDAINDVKYTGEALAGQLNDWPNIPRTVPELSEFCFKKKDGIDKTGKFIWVDDVPCINFGKHRGTPLKNVEKSYLIWMINTPDFPDDAIIVAGNALKNIYPEKK